MKGLILKDFLTVRKVIRSYLLVVLLYTILGLLGVFQLSITMMMAQTMIGMLPLSAFTYDQTTNWDCYAASLPVSRRDIVAGRYGYSLLLTLVVTAYNMVIAVLSTLMKPETAMDNVICVLVALGIGLLTLSAGLPFCYRFGAERARLFIFAVLAVVGVGPILFLLIARETTMLNITISESGFAAGTAVFALIGVVALVISFFISCRVVEKKTY